MGSLGRIVCKARAKTGALPAIPDQASKVAPRQGTVTPPEQPRCATLEQLVTIGTALPSAALPRQKQTLGRLEPRQQEPWAFRHGLAQPLQIICPASEPVQGMEVARQHVIPTAQAVFGTVCGSGTIE